MVHRDDGFIDESVYDICECGHVYPELDGGGVQLTSRRLLLVVYPDHQDHDE